MVVTRKVRVAVNGYGVIGKRVADTVTLQDDMQLAGIVDVASYYLRGNLGGHGAGHAGLIPINKKGRTT